MDNFLVCDVETSGLDPATAEIIEIAAIEMTPEGKVLSKFARKVFPTQPVDPAAAKVNGYTFEGWMKTAVSREMAIDSFNTLCRGKTLQLLGWNPSFDLGFIRPWVRAPDQGGFKLSYHPVDIFSMLYPLILQAGVKPSEAHRRYVSLGDAIKHFLPDQSHLLFHTAGGDVDACILLYRYIRDRWAGYGADHAL